MDYISDSVLNKKQKKYLEDLKKDIRSKMYPKLYQHSISTLKFAEELADIYIFKGSNKKSSTIESFFKLCISCILHDYGKIFRYEELVKIVKDEKIAVSEFELNSPSLIHSFVGSYLVKRDFDIIDEEILNSIKFHTVGYYNMSINDKILYISDKLEENRKYDRLENLRKLSHENIDLCLLEVYKSNIIYVLNRNRLLYPETSRIWNNICGGK